MRSIYRLQYKVLAFACKPKSAPPFDDQTIFIRRFGHLWGAWLFERVSLSEKFRTALINLIRHIDGDTSKRQVILQAFLNDTQFHRKLNAPSFNFHRNLDQDTRALLKELMELFYDYLLDTGFPDISTSSATKFSRKDFRKAFWAANADLDLCPACDGARPPSISGVVQSENDHFFPKSAYPFLAVHFSNLLPMCKYCNQSFKKTIDPIDDHDNQPLARSFFPYEMPANELMEIAVSRANSGERDVSIEAKDTKDRIRAKNLDRLLSLQLRWKDELEHTIKRLIEDLSEHHRLSQPQPDSFLCLLQGKLNYSKQKQGLRNGNLLIVSYLEFAIHDTGEMRALQKEVNRIAQSYAASFQETRFV